MDEVIQLDPMAALGQHIAGALGAAVTGSEIAFGELTITVGRDAIVSVASFLQYFDFVSLGTNDLIQYTLAIDRADEAVAHLYDPWHPAVLSLVSSTIARARAAGKDVSVCGEMAGDPGFTELLLAMGLRSFSMHPAQIAAVKQRVLRADTRQWAPRLRDMLDAEDPQALFATLGQGST